MKDWKSQAHVKWECKYHVVILPKYRPQLEFLDGESRFVFRTATCAPVQIKLDFRNHDKR